MKKIIIFIIIIFTVNFCKADLLTQYGFKVGVNLSQYNYRIKRNFPAVLYDVVKNSSPGQNYNIKLNITILEINPIALESGIFYSNREHYVHKDIHYSFPNNYKNKSKILSLPLTLKLKLINKINLLCGGSYNFIIQRLPGSSLTIYPNYISRSADNIIMSLPDQINTLHIGFDYTYKLKNNIFLTHDLIYNFGIFDFQSNSTTCRCYHWMIEFNTGIILKKKYLDKLKVYDA